MKVIAYLRVSTEQQRDTHLGLDVQRDQIESYCSERDLGINMVCSDEAVSGSLRYHKRPGLKKALEALSKGDILITTRRDRLAREQKALSEIELYIADRGATYVSIAGEGQQSGSAAIGFMDRAVRDMFGQLEIEFAKERTKAALDKKRARGEYLGELPRGYRLAADGIHLEVDPYEVQMMDMMCAYRDAGMTYQAIADKMNEIGHTSRIGRPVDYRYTHRVISGRRTQLRKEMAC